mmetsp:Transcript_160/g.512  ORF Transcript_160/g.512 Transcript_160/m.512 type:complete len:229 (+) Transcript_160:393-1079(+)
MRAARVRGAERGGGESARRSRAAEFAAAGDGAGAAVRVRAVSGVVRRAARRGGDAVLAAVARRERAGDRRAGRSDGGRRELAAGERVRGSEAHERGARRRPKKPKKPKKPKRPPGVQAGRAARALPRPRGVRLRGRVSERVQAPDAAVPRRRARSARDARAGLRDVRVSVFVRKDAAAARVGPRVRHAVFRAVPGRARRGGRAELRPAVAVRERRRRRRGGLRDRVEE